MKVLESTLLSPIREGRKHVNRYIREMFLGILDEELGDGIDKVVKGHFRQRKLLDRKWSSVDRKVTMSRTGNILDPLLSLKQLRFRILVEMVSGA